MEFSREDFDNQAFRDDILKQLHNQLLIGIEEPVERDGLLYSLSPDGKDKVVIVGNKNYDFKANDGVLYLAGADEVATKAFMLCAAIKLDCMDVTVIQNHAFYNCESLVSLRGDKIIFIGDMAFAYNYKLESLVLPECQTFGNACFKLCYSIKDVKLPELRSCGDEAFNGCDGITMLKLDNLEEIGRMSFANCSRLTKISLSKFNGFYALKPFLGCDNLKVAVLPSISMISNDFFEGASNIEELLAPFASIRLCCVNTLSSLCILCVSHISNDETFATEEEPEFIRQNMKSRLKLNQS